MGKKLGYQKRDSKSTKTRKDIVADGFDDDIDIFHKQRDIVPLDVNDDTDESDEDDDDVQPVFDLKGVEDEDTDEEDEDEDEDENEKGLTAKIIRQEKYLRGKILDVNDDMADNDEEDEEDKRSTWNVRPGRAHGADNVDFDDLSSDDEDLKAEEEEVIRLRGDQAKYITRADAGLEDDSEEESDRELTMGEIPVKGKRATKFITDKDSKETHVEEIKKDINSLSKEEQMDVVISSAPEIVGLLSELNDAVEELETKINPVMTKLKEGEIPLNGVTRYLEVKEALLLAYCQSITFYFLLKSEGQPIRDHPVLARLVDIKALIDKIKELDGNLPPGFEESLAKSIANGAVQKVVNEDAPSSPVSAPVVRAELVQNDKSREDKKRKGEKRKQQNDQVDMQSEEMLKLRAALEVKLRSNGVFGSTVSKSDKAQKRQKLANRKLETFDDYVDDADNSTHDGKLTKLVSTKRKPKTVSGDDDLPQRDDIGERRRKYELRVLADAGVKSEEDGRNESGAFASDDDNDNDNDDDDDDDDMVDKDGESEDEFYKQVKQKQEAKRAAKAEIYSRKPHLMPAEPESVDGKRLISHQIQGNRGLTRHRNKDLKNPRKKYRVKHDQKVKRRSGQVRAIRKPTGSYGGEVSGINPNVSKSIRIKN